MAKKGGLGGLGLGRGLDALMGGSDAANAEIKESIEGKSSSAVVIPTNLPEGIEVDEMGGLWVDPSRLIPNPKQPRTHFDAKALEELADSIRVHGVIEPILIEKDENSSNFYIIAGERRTRAAKMAGITKVPVQIRKYDEVKKLEVALIENIQRADLDPIEEAKAYHDLMILGDINQEEVAKRVGKGRSTVANSVRLLNLPEDMQKALANKDITSGHARALLAVENPADQRFLFSKIINDQINVRMAESLAKDYNNGGRAANDKSKKVVKKDADIEEIEQKFIDIFGTKVVLKGSIEKGSIQIDYFSRQDLDRVYNIIVQEH